MSEETHYIGRTELGPDSYLGPTQYRISFLCRRCGNTFKRIYRHIPPIDPPCPKKSCKAAVLADARAAMERNLRRMIEAERGPGHIGSNQTVKNIDATAEIVMKDHGLTNLKDNIREGEIMAPRLPPKQQEAADNFFNHKPPPGADDRRRKQMDLLGRRAMAGAFRGNAINPGALVPGERGQPILRRIGTEKI